MAYLRCRKAAGLTQAFVAQQLDTTTSAISQWENGKTKPRIELLPKLAKLYGVTVDQLLTED